MYIRPATSADLPAVLTLMAQLDLGHDAGFSLESAAAVFQQIDANPNHTIYVAEQDGAVVGTFALIIIPQLAHGGSCSGIIEDVVVSPDHRGQGIGQEMMRFAMAICRQARCYKLVLSSNKQREAAHRFYENLGFQQHGYSFLIEVK
jgi:GNAT superfamily N-acetyltransferase